MRTGTRTQKLALERLGYRVLHMEDLGSLGLTKHFFRALTSDAALDGFLETILAMGFNATLDSPLCFLSMELAKRYPDAKVLLATRDSPEQYRRSIENLLSAFKYSGATPFRQLVDFEFYESVSLRKRVFVSDEPVRTADLKNKGRAKVRGLP